MLRVYLQHDHVKVYARVNIENGVGKLDIVQYKADATHMQSASAWVPIINDLYKAGFDTRPWSIKLDFGK